MTDQASIWTPAQSPGKPEIRPRGLTIKEAARYAGVSRWTIQRLLGRGEIVGFYIGAAHLIDLASLDAFLDRQKGRAERHGG